MSNVESQIFVIILFLHFVSLVYHHRNFDTPRPFLGPTSKFPANDFRNSLKIYGANIASDNVDNIYSQVVLAASFGVIFNLCSAFDYYI
jgi:hypothetical protein